MINFKGRFITSTLIATLAITLAFTGSEFESSYANETDGVPITVQVVTPSAAPSPPVVAPVPIPVNVSVADAVFPIVLTGLEPNSYVEIFSNSTPVLVASGFADSTGRFEASVRLPPNLAVGNHTITAINTLSNGTKVTTVAVAFSVTSSGKIATPTSGGESASSAQVRAASSSAGTSAQGAVSEESIAGSNASVSLGPDPFNLGGVLYVGGLMSRAIYPKNIFDPAAQVSFSVRNVSSEKVTSVLDFSVRNAAGMVVSEFDGFTLKDLKPGETRKVTAQLRDIGQWGVYTVDMTLTPPKNVGANTLTSFTLTSNFFALAAWVLLSMLILALLAGTYFLGRRVWGWLPLNHYVIKFQHALFPKASDGQGLGESAVNGDESRSSTSQSTASQSAASQSTVTSGAK